MFIFQIPLVHRLTIPELIQQLQHIISITYHHILHIFQTFMKYLTKPNHHYLNKLVLQTHYYLQTNNNVYQNLLNHFRMYLPILQDVPIGFNIIFRFNLKVNLGILLLTEMLLLVNKLLKKNLMKCSTTVL